LVQAASVLTLEGRPLPEAIEDGPEGDRPLRTIAAHASAYIAHVRRQLRHMLPKAIVHCEVRWPCLCRALCVIGFQAVRRQLAPCATQGHRALQGLGVASLARGSCIEAVRSPGAAAINVQMPSQTGVQGAVLTVANHVQHAVIVQVPGGTQFGILSHWTIRVCCERSFASPIQTHLEFGRSIL
jgi:Dynamin GTPase effector domain